MPSLYNLAGKIGEVMDDRESLTYSHTECEWSKIELAELGEWFTLCQFTEGTSGI